MSRRDREDASDRRAVRRVGVVVAVCLMIAASVARGDEPKVDPEARAAIDGAVRWLAGKQQPGGNWGNQFKVAQTGYVLMGLMAAGQVPDEGPQGAAVGRGVRYLMDCVRADGYVAAPDEVNSDKGMYGHGIATIALAEACGQAGGAGGRDDVRAQLRRAVRLIVTTQNQAGGWRYFPRVADADLSVTVLQVVALRAARNDGIDVPRETIDRAVAYVRSCRDERGSGGFCYQPGQVPGFARTAAAVYSLQVCGLYDDPMVRAGSDYLLRQQATGRYAWFTYGNFYAAPAQYMVGGAAWGAWYPAVRKTIMGRVRREGDLAYWPPVEGDGSGGSPVYVTAVNTLILAMPDGAVPLYQR